MTIYDFCLELYKNPRYVEKRANIYHAKNNQHAIRHVLAHGALSVVFIRQRKIIPACEQVYLATCAPFFSVYRKYRNQKTK